MFIINQVIVNKFKFNGKKTKLQKGDLIRFIPEHKILAFYRPSTTLMIENRILNDFWGDKMLLGKDTSINDFFKLIEIISFASGFTAKPRPDLDKEESYYEFC